MIVTTGTFSDVNQCYESTLQNIVVSQHAQYENPEIEAAELNSVIISFIMCFSVL